MIQSSNGYMLYPMSRSFSHLTSSVAAQGLILHLRDGEIMSQSHHEYRDPEELSRHPLNQDVYGDLTLEPDFIDSIEQHGILEPILIKSDGTIISGHRRYTAASEVGLDEVPVREVSFDSDLAEREAVIHHNKQRTKTFSQKMREAMELEKIERERAKERQGERTDIKQTFASSEFGQTRDKVASELDMSGETYRKAKRVWEAAKEDGIERMENEVEKIENGAQSIDGAYKTLKRWEDLQELDGAVEWRDVRNVGPDEIGDRRSTFSDSKSGLSENDEWTDSLSQLIDEHESRWEESGQGNAFVFSYLLEDAGFAEFSGEDIDPESFEERKPDHDSLFELYWEDERELSELAVRFGADTALVKHWMFEMEIPLRARELTEAQRDKLR